MTREERLHRMEEEQQCDEQRYLGMLDRLFRASNTANRMRKRLIRRAGRIQKLWAEINSFPDADPPAPVPKKVRRRRCPKTSEN